MTRGVRWYLVSSLVLAALIAVAGCSHYMLAEREPWRAEAELSCLNSGAVKESAARVRISPIDGPGACGMAYPLRVSALGASSALGYDDESMRPPERVPNGAMPQSWPGQGSSQGYGQPIQSSTLPPVQQSAPQYNPYQQSPAPQSSATAILSRAVLSRDRNHTRHRSRIRKPTARRSRARKSASRCRSIRRDCRSPTMTRTSAFQAVRRIRITAAPMLRPIHRARRQLNRCRRSDRPTRR